MKHKILLFSLFIGAIMVTSCKKEDNSAASTNNTSIAGVISTGTWRVSFFHESSNDHTANFNGYAFGFSSNRNMTATDSAGTTIGTWRIDDSNVNQFHMSIGTVAPLLDLSKGWLITSQTSTEIQMKDDGSSNEVLHFVKI